jgi:phenylacetate-CoA ligase
MNDENNTWLDEILGRFQKTLEASERAPRALQHRYQQALLKQLVKHAYETVPFYRDRLANLIDGDEIDLSRWNEVPILTRDTIVAHRDEMQSCNVPPQAGSVQEILTTGTTGKPLRIAYNQLNKVAAVAAFRRTARWWGLEIPQSAAKIVIYVQDEGANYPAGRDTSGLSFSRVHELDMLTSPENQIEWLLRKNATYLITSPVNATALAYTITPDQALKLGIKAVLAHGETVLPRVRELILERLGAPLIAFYSCQEVGYIATQCPVTTHYHVMAENVFVEILRDDGSPSAPGEPGQVVVTSLYNYAMPFIRYAIGDVATPGPEYCTCGMTLPVIEQIDGRTRYAFEFEDGSRVWPRLINFDVSPFVAYREFQLVQVDRKKIELRYVPNGDQSPDKAGLDAYIREKIHHSASVELVPMQALPRGPGGKLTPFISLVE